ncbi:MAG: 30S ribosomal protein S20 [Planctomycetes bacterium]|nr:30S ribosomal protein S20 [Planctomycetota bacterium]MBM3991954.1 30S ribosomal protein S20 [Planctomycetota bacterium]
MTHSKQAAKRVRTSNRRRNKNRAVRSAVKSKAKATVASAPSERPAMLRESMKMIDKAAKVGVIHKNAAARKKSRLMKALNKLAAAK